MTGHPSDPAAAGCTSLPHILVLAFLYPPATEVGALRPARFVKYLRRAGYPVTIISAGPGKGPVVEGMVHRLRGDLEHYAPNFTEKVLRKALLPYGWGAAWAFRAARYALGSLDPRTVVFSTAPPMAAHGAAAWLKARHRVPWIADFRDPFMQGNSRFSASFASRAERVIARTADCIIANTDGAGLRWKERYPGEAHKIDVLWNGFDPEERLCPLPLPVRPGRILSHLGSIYRTRHPDPLLRALEGSIRQNRSEVRGLKVQLVGPCETAVIPDPDRLNSLAGLGHVELLPAVPRTAAQQLMATSDYLLLLDLLEGETAGLHVPAKVFEYLQIGRPVLACAKKASALGRILAWSGVPHMVLHPDDSQEELEQKLLQFLSFRTEPTPMNQDFAEAFAADRQTEHLCRLIQDLDCRRHGTQRGSELKIF